MGYSSLGEAQRLAQHLVEALRGLLVDAEFGEDNDD
jgi:hypothetical protein